MPMPTMPPTPQPLAPLALPLQGSHLIEASAGTGKTYTIALLYVRLVLGHGDTHAFGAQAGAGRPLTPPEILVVTFTEAATQELRDRIRARLAETAQLFRADPASAAPAPGLLQALRASYPPASWPACARKLELAAEWMDEAAVSTIHGWCHRMLREHAFDSQSLFTQTLETDTRHLQAEVVRDYWRHFYYPLEPQDMAEVLACWDSPAALEKAVSPLLPHAAQLADPGQAPAQLLAQCRQHRATALAALKAPWPDWIASLRALLQTARQQKQFNGTRLKPSSYEGWLDKLQHWASSSAEQPGLTPAALKRLSPDGLAEAWTSGSPPDHPLLHELARLPAALAGLPEPRTTLLTHAARWIATEFAATQKRLAQMGFDDLLTGLEAALRGPNGARLAELIRRQFPVALIDEFQDTDPIQYRIFDHVYELARQRQDTTLILIGDPKQAIYAFRGADIHTYLEARRAVQGRVHTLGTNYRSSQAMVAATNYCFLQQEHKPDTPGAFLFRAGAENPVPFLAVAAQGRKEVFQVHGQAVAALKLSVQIDASPSSKSAYIETMAEVCASRIVAWLQLAEQGQAGFAAAAPAALTPAPQPLLPLRPGDMAVLVNNAQEASRIRQALGRRGVRSVYLSDKETVYATPQAEALYHWLAAVAEPDNERLLRAALASPILGLSYHELDALNHQENQWEARILQFKGYREIWKRQGILPLVRRILMDFHCSDRLLDPSQQEEPSGERILTDILHLAELLQQASFTQEGEHALLRYLAEQMADPGADAEGRRLRLESDADLVQVVTIHKSKGLEYPLVFLPFIAAARAVEGKSLPLKWHDAHGRLQLALRPSPEVLAQAEQERLGEDLRKLYVALTRARHHTWIGLARLNQAGPSAIDTLLDLNPGDPAAYLDRLHKLHAASPQSDTAANACLDLEINPAATPERYQSQAHQPPPGSACRPTRPARDNWWIASYSSLPLEGRSPHPALPDDSPRAANVQESQLEVSLSLLPFGQSWSPVPGTPQASLATPSPMHRFPKGARAGSFLHELLEWAARRGFAATLAAPAALAQMLARQSRVHGWEDWCQPLQDWLVQFLCTPLPLGDVTLELRQLQIARPELEFWFQVSQVDLEQLDRLILQHTLAGRPRPRLQAEQLNGMLKGYIDLVFEYQGRYYLVDYKSNWLGPQASAYTATAMDAAIRAHRYDLQYVIYLFALHRLLQARLPDYDYERHIGGAAYFFLRGLDAPGAGVHFERPPLALIQALEKHFSGTAGDTP